MSCALSFQIANSLMQWMQNESIPVQSPTSPTPRRPQVHHNRNHSHQVVTRKPDPISDVLIQDFERQSFEEFMRSHPTIRHRRSASTSSIASSNSSSRRSSNASDMPTPTFSGSVEYFSR